MNYEAKALAIAGSDSGGGAGIQADLKTFQAFNVYGMTAITSVTAQNTVGLRSIFDLDPAIVADQIEMVVEDIGVDAVKVGMLSNARIIEEVIRCVKKYRLKKIVVDPVMVSKTGASLLKPEAQKSLNGLLEIAFLATPNIYEAEKISGMEIKDLKGVEKAARLLSSMGIENTLIKGGHLKGDKVVDILYDGKGFHHFESPRIKTKNTHGTGCTYSSAIAASLAKGLNLREAVYIAKDYISRALKESPASLGQGNGPLYHNIKPIGGKR
ncbi:MAG: bifunctional hydroxymethylpyrimidine kinase/phosphomethylpyrimidine kinase [Actinomycetota bacterium]